MSRGVTGMNNPAASKASAPSGGTSRRGHCQASPASIFASGAGHGATPARRRGKGIPQPHRRLDSHQRLPGSSNFRARPRPAGQRQVTAPRRRSMPRSSAARWRKLPPHHQQCRRADDRRRSAGARTTFPATRRSSPCAPRCFALACQWSRWEFAEPDVMGGK